MSEDNKYAIDVVASFAERTTKRLIIVIILLIAIIVAGVVAFVIREDGYEVQTTEIEATTDDGGTVMANMMGVMTYGNNGEDHNNAASEKANDQEDNQRN